MLGTAARHRDVPHDKARRGLCCSSPASIRYWFAVSLIAWGVLCLVGIFWYRLHALSAATILLAMAIGCLANWLRNRTFHCAITGPIFLIAATAFLLSDVRVMHLAELRVWLFVSLGVCIAFLL